MSLYVHAPIYTISDRISSRLSSASNADLVFAELILGAAESRYVISSNVPSWLRELSKVAAEVADTLEARQEDCRAAQAAAEGLAAAGELPGAARVGELPDVAVHCGPDAGGAL